MTPVLPTYKHYTQNLIVMTSGDAKRLWRKAIKEANNYECIYCGQKHYEFDLTIDMYIPDVWEVLPILATVFPPVDDVIKKKEV